MCTQEEVLNVMQKDKWYTYQDLSFLLYGKKSTGNQISSMYERIRCLRRWGLLEGCRETKKIKHRRVK